MRKLVVALLLTMLVAPASAQTGSVMGTWLTASGVAQVRIGPCDSPANGPVCGVIVGLINPKGPNGQVVASDMATDFRNPDHLAAAQEGHIYNGENGKVYTANISLQPDGTLRLRGYVGSPMFGETQIWTRLSQ